MKKFRYFLKSLRFRIFISVLIFGIVPIVVLNIACPEMSFFRTNLVLVIIIAAAAVWSSLYMTRPLNKLIMSIGAVKGGYEDDFVPVDTYSETESISDACGDMLGRLKAQDQRQVDFVSNVSHELKTPLTSMKVLADSLIVQENVPVDIYREFMEDIGEEIGRENAIIDDLLSMVRMNSEGSDITPVRTDVGAMLEYLVKHLRPLAENSGVDISLNIVRPVEAGTDWTKLNLAFSNLIENAIKYNHSGGWVRVTLDADHHDFFVTVEDGGIGIPEAEQEQIFERFYRVDKSHSRSIKGTGLGLALTRDAVALHHGSITVESVPGRGSKFLVKIPITYDDARVK